MWVYDMKKIINKFKKLSKKKKIILCLVLLLIVVAIVVGIMSLNKENPVEKINHRVA